MDAEEQKRRRKEIQLTLLPGGKIHSTFAVDFYTILIRHIESSGWSLTENLLDKIVILFENCESLNESINYLEIGDAFYCLSVLNPLEVDLEFSRFLCYLKLLKEKEYECTDSDPPYTKILAGFMLGVFKIIGRRTYFLTGESANFTQLFPTVITHLIAYGGNHHTWTERKNWIVKEGEFKGHISTEIKSALTDHFQGEKVKQLYLEALSRLDLKRLKPKRLGDILYREIFFALIGIMDDDQRRELITEMAKRKYVEP